MMFGIIAACFLLGSSGETELKTTLESLVVLSLAPIDGKAVLRLPTGEMELIEVGESIPGTSLVVRQTLPDRLVLEEDSEKPITIWLFKATRPGGKSRVQILEHTPPPEAEVREPQQKKKDPSGQRWQK